MRINLFNILLFSILFLFMFIFGAITKFFLILLISFILLNLLSSITWGYGLLISILISGIFNLTFNFRVFLEALVVELNSKEGYFKYFDDISKNQKEGEKPKSSIPIEVLGRKYMVIEFAKYFFDPRAKDKNDLKGFLIYNEKDGKSVIEKDLQKRVLSVYLFWRHIYFNDDILEDISLKNYSKSIFKSQIKFLNAFKKQITQRMKEGYPSENFKDSSFIPTLKELDAEVYNQAPFIQKKLEIEISIFDSLYNLFTKPSEERYNELVKKIEDISNLSREENQIWNRRLTTWKNLVKHYDLRIDNLLEPNFKKVNVSILADLIKYIFSKKDPIISEETLIEILGETIKIPRKKILKSLNNYFVSHKLGIDAIKKNIEINQKFRRIAEDYKKMMDNSPIEKIRN